MGPRPTIDYHPYIQRLVSDDDRFDQEDLPLLKILPLGGFLGAQVMTPESGVHIFEKEKKVLEVDYFNEGVEC